MRVFLGRPQLSRGRNARRWAVRDRARLARVRAEAMPGGRTNATKVIGAPYRRPEASAGGGPTCKASANEWLARVTVALHGHLRDAGREPAASPWALVLDTERCDTILALDEAGAIPKRRCVVPNPDAAVCRAARTHGAHAVEATSHAVLVPDGPVHPLLRAAAAAAPPRAPDPIPGLPDACRGAIGCVWLDYCGGVSSRGGRRRREDVRAILAPADAPDAWLAPHAVLALTVSERGAPAMYDGDSLDAVVCLVRDAAARGGRRAAVVGTCSYGGSSGATRRRARMHTAVFAVGPEPSAEWLEDIARTLPAPVRTPGMNTTRGWTLVLGRGDEGARGRDVAVQRRLPPDAFAAVAAVNRRRRRTRPKYTPRVVIVESRLLPATRAVRAAVPDADVAVAVEDDLDRLVAASAAPRRRARPSVLGRAPRRGEDRETRRCDEDRETRRCDEDAVASYASGAFLDYTGRTRAFARRELASCDAWPQLAATLREFRRGASRRGGARRRAQRLGRRRVLGRTGDRLRRVGDSTRGATGGGGGDGTRGGGGEEEEGRRRRRRRRRRRWRRRRRRLGRILGRILAGCRYFARRVECVRPVAARGCARGRSLRARRRFGSRRRFGFARKKAASVGIPIPATVSTCLSWDVARRKTPRSNATLEWTLPALDALPPTRARAVMIAEPGGLVVAPALLARGAGVRVVACDDAHLAEERRRVERSPRGSDTVRVVVHASPRDAANALDAETVAVGGVDDDSDVYGSGSRARLPLLPRFSCWCPRSTPDLFARRGARSPPRGLDARSRRTATAGASWR